MSEEHDSQENSVHIGGAEDLEAQKSIIYEGFANLYDTVAYNISVFAGVGLMAFSILSFDHGRYCDGTEADHFSCLNSATYYEYDWWVVGLFVIGTLSVTYWIVRRQGY